MNLPLMMKLAARKDFRWLILLVCTLLVSFVGFKVKMAGDMRAARFNVISLLQVVQEYYKKNKVFPFRLDDLPKFYAVSALDRLYFSSDDILDGAKGSYIYHLQHPDVDKIVISASPKRHHLFYCEFGITEKGTLRFNPRHTDPTADSYEEVEGWASYRLPHTSKLF